MGGRWNILIEESGGDAVVRALRDAGVEVSVTAVDGAAAVMAAAHESFDWIAITGDVACADDCSLLVGLRERGVRAAIVVLLDQGDEQPDDQLDDQRVGALVAAGATDALVPEDLASPGLVARLRMAMRLAEAEDRAAGVSRLSREEASEHRAAAERASRTLKETLSIVSHDLRGPLNSIGIAAEELRDPGLTDGERTSYLNAIGRAVERATRLIEDILDAERSVAGTLVIEPSPVRVVSLLEQARRARDLDAKKAGIELVIAEGSSLGEVRVSADAARVQQVLDNLLGNALRHSTRGGSITMSVEPIGAIGLGGSAQSPGSPAGRGDGDGTGEAILIAVTDTGKGIPADMIEHVFDRFVQARSKRRGNAGLGLAIARGIVEAHGGTIGVHSVEGQGAKFWFTLRRA